ncbi:hypothetical protein ACSBR2_015693 [Camellia fascicularis]
MLAGFQSITLIYRIYYKCIKTNLNVHALVKSPKDKTVLIQSSTSKAIVDILRPIVWSEITLLENWLTVNENYTHKIHHDVNDLNHIQQYSDGSSK